MIFENGTYKDISVIFYDEQLAQHGDLDIDGVIGWEISYQSKIAYNLDKKMIYVKN